MPPGYGDVHQVRRIHPCICQDFRVRADELDAALQALIARSGVALSAPSKGKEADCASYRSFEVPCLHMTGTEDSSPIGDTTPSQRRIPFDCINGPDQYLVTFAGGDHMVFSGDGQRLYVGDIRAGRVLVVDLPAKQMRWLAPAPARHHRE